MVPPKCRDAALAAALVALSTAPSLAADPCDPMAAGAVGDGQTDNTAVLQATIGACSAAGGGVVALTGGGVFMTGPIQLLDHVYLQVDTATTLQAVADQSRFVAAYIGAPFQANEALVFAYNATDVGVFGAGTIDGQGAPYWVLANIAKANGTAGTNGLPRPWLIEFYQSSHVSVSGVTLTNSPMWNLALRNDRDVFVEGVSVLNPPDSPNTDGVDIVSSSNVRLSHLTIDTGDDNIAIKSGLPTSLDTGPVPAVPTTYLTVSNSVFRRGHGLSIGSEAVNGVQHVRASNIAFVGTDNAIRIKSGRDRGSDISDIIYRDITMTDVGAAIVLTDYYTGLKPPSDPAQPITPTTPFIHDIVIQNVTSTAGATSPGGIKTVAGTIYGLPESPILNLSLNNVSLSAATGLIARNVSGAASALTVSAASGPNLINQGGVSVPGSGF